MILGSPSAVGILRGHYRWRPNVGVLDSLTGVVNRATSRSPPPSPTWTAGVALAARPEPDEERNGIEGRRQTPPLEQGLHLVEGGSGVA